MIRTVLVPTSGTDADRSVFATALAVGSLCAAHLHFFHVRLGPAAAAYRAHLEYCQGAGLAEALERLRLQADELAAAAARHVAEFCSAHAIDTCEAAAATQAVTAHRSEERDEPLARLLLHARHNDVVVVGRRHHPDHLPDNLIQALLVDSGRPLLIAAAEARPSLTGTIVVGWKESPEAARALAAALPLLRQARRVILCSVAESAHDSGAPVKDVARQLLWHGVRAETVRVAFAARPVSAELAGFAVGEGADLLVVGGFGHAPFREWVFGGVTQSLIEHAELPVFMVH